MVVDVVASSLWGYFRLNDRFHFEVREEPRKLVVIYHILVLKFLGINVLSDLLLGARDYFYFHLITLAIFGLDVLGRTDALEVAVDHDAQFRGEGLSLLHRMGSQDDGRLLFLRGDPGDDLPHEPPCLGIHACRGLIQKDDVRVAYHGHGN